jgi:hypothetical protein
VITHERCLDAGQNKCCGALIALRNMILKSRVADMKEIVERVLISHGGDVSGSREKVRHYLGLLASTGKSDDQLFVLGKAYLKEILQPDSRYSGC